MALQCGDNCAQEETLKGFLEPEEREKDGETPEERFKRISEGRINNVTNSLRILAKMGNSPGYDYSKEDIERMFKHIDKAVEQTKRAFSNTFIEEFKWK